EREQQKRTVINYPPRMIEPPAPPTPAPSASPEHRGGKKRHATAPRRQSDGSSPLFAEARGGRLAPDGASLPAGKKIHADPFGDDSIGKQFRDQLIAALHVNRRFTLTTNRDEADAVLKGKLTATGPGQMSATVRLVNAKGEVLWPVNGPITGKQYQGPIATI